MYSAGCIAVCAGFITALYGESSRSRVLFGPNLAYDDTAQSACRSLSRMGFPNPWPGPAAGSMAPTCVHLSWPHTNASRSRCLPHMWFTSVRALWCCAEDQTPTVKCSDAHSTKLCMCGRL